MTICKKKKQKKNGTELLNDVVLTNTFDVNFEQV